MEQSPRGPPQLFHIGGTFCSGEWYGFGEFSGLRCHVFERITCFASVGHSIDVL